MDFNFPVFKSSEDENKPAWERMRHPDAADKVYLLAKSIGYDMTVQEVYSFLEVMMTRKTSNGKTVTNLPGLMQCWQDNQTPETNAQAQEEEQQLNNGVKIPFVIFGKELARKKPFGYGINSARSTDNANNSILNSQAKYIKSLSISQGRPVDTEDEDYKELLSLFEQIRRNPKGFWIMERGARLQRASRNSPAIEASGGKWGYRNTIKCFERAMKEAKLGI